MRTKMVKNWSSKLPDNIVKLDRDTIPKEVATEMLCAPKARITNRERKMFNDARSTVYTSSRVAIPEDQKTSVWLQGRHWMQLHIQLARCTKSRATAQRHFQFLQRQSTKLDSRTESGSLGIALLERQMAALDLHVAGLDALREAVENEIARRKNFCDKLAELTPSVAKKLRRSLCGK